MTSKHIEFLLLKIATTQAMRRTPEILQLFGASLILFFVPCSLFLGIAKFRVRGKSNINDFTLAAKACLPIISAILAEIKTKHYPQNCFLNIDVPTDVVNHKVNFMLACFCCL